MKTITLSPGKLTLADLRDIYSSPVHIELCQESYEQIQKSVQCVSDITSNPNAVAYGINTGFGLLASQRIPTHDLKKLQRSLVLSHAAGVGKNIDDHLVRLIMALKINSLSRGFSGIRLEVIQGLIQLLNAEIYPCIPEKGSVGASGDLAPLAHMSLVLIGEGSARYKGEIISGLEALMKANLEPITLDAKEGLALLNGTQASTAFALKGLFDAEDLFATAIGCGALNVEASLGSRKPFDSRVHEIRGHKGQILAAECYRHVLSDFSEISKSHENCVKVQDPYSLRCQPQVMGACLTQLLNVADTLLIESNAVSDNPLIFTDNGDIISGGNFHAEPVAMAADNMDLSQI